MTAHNEHTGASMTTAGKGNLEKYAQGWEGIFKPKKQEFVGEHSWTLANGTVISFKGDPNGYAEWTSTGGPMYFEGHEFQVAPTVERNPQDDAVFADMHSRKEDFSIEAVGQAFAEVGTLGGRL